MKMIRKLVNVVVDLFTVLIMIYLIFLAICGVSKCIPYIVLSGSMEPSIRTGSLCIVDTRVPFDQIKVGDVVAFVTGNGQMVTHRAVVIRDGMIETKGDANAVTDGFTTSEVNYHGKTLLSIPYLGYVISWVQTVRGKILSVTGLVSLILFGWLLDEWDKNRVQIKGGKGVKDGRSKK